MSSSSTSSSPSLPSSSPPSSLSPGPRRANRLANTAARGAWIGLLAGLIVGLADVLGSARSVWAQFDDRASWLGFVARQAVLPLGPAAVLGVIVTLVATLLARLADRQALGRAGPSHRWLATYVALFAVPGLIWLSLQLFAGPRAQRIPGRLLLQLIGVAIGFVVVRRITAWVASRLGRRQPGLALLSLVVLSLCMLADRLILPRLYPWFHHALQAGVLFCALLVPAALLPPESTADPPSTVGGGGTANQRWRWIVVVLLPLLAVPFALRRSQLAVERLHRATVLRSHILEHTTIAATLMQPYAALRTAQKLRRQRAYAIAPLPEGPQDPTEQQVVPPPYRGPRFSGRDVFLITVDALRHDRLHLMPTVQTLAARGVVFSRAYTQVPHTSFALATLLTGKPVYALLTLGQDAASHETLPLILRRFRYKTAAFYPPSVFYIEHDRLKSLEDSAYGFEYVKYEYLEGRRRTDQVLAFLQTEKPAHAFVWVHYLEPHEPYDRHADLPVGSGETPLPENASDGQRYDGEIAYVDREIARLVAYLQVHRPGALVIIAADHGEEFGEHGGRYHGTTLYEELVHIPLIVSTVPGVKADGHVGQQADAPGTAPTTDSGGASDPRPAPMLRFLPQTQRTPVGLLDVAPTLLGLLDIERSARMRGRDLSPWILSGSQSVPLGPVFAEIGRKKMVVLGDDKLICDLSTDACQLFQLGLDPTERRNVLGLRADVAARLRALLNRSLAEAQRYEAQPREAFSPTAEPPAGLDAQVLARAQQGDREVLPDLLTALAQVGPDAAQRHRLLRLLGPLIATRLPTAGDPTVDPLAALATPSALAGLASAQRDAEAAGDLEGSRWAAVARVRLSAASSPAGSATELAASLPSVRSLLFDAKANADQRLCGALALAALAACQPTSMEGGRDPDCVALWIDSQVLPAALAMQDADRVRPLIDRMGESRDRRVLPSLLAVLDNVLSRADLVRALGVLGQVDAVPALRDRLLRDPYVHVRVAAAGALGRLAATSDRAKLALQAAEKTEPEAAVRGAIAVALGKPAPSGP